MIINGERALAYIVEVAEVKPIPNYDRVEYARVNGWWVIIGKGDLKQGDKGVYFEIDSLVPAEDERFAFMEKRNFKVKTQKMCKVISQGLLLPLTEFPELGDKPIGADVTKELKVIYYETKDNERKDLETEQAKIVSMKARHKKIFASKLGKWLMRREWGRKVMLKLFGRKKVKSKSFPTHFPFVHKTDEERIENLPHLLGSPEPYIVTEKLDGTSATYILERKKIGYEFYVLSRNVRQKDEKQSCYHDRNVYWDMAFKYNIKEKMIEFLKDSPDLTYICIQGEICGPGVQANPLKLKSVQLFVFNFITSSAGRLPSIVAKEYITNHFKIPFVPILATNFMIPNDMEQFKVMADGKSVLNEEVMREGIVCREPIFDTSFKNISRNFLLKHS